MVVPLLYMYQKGFIFLFFNLLVVKLFCQSLDTHKSNYPKFVFKSSLSACMNWGMVKSGHGNKNILRTPPSVGPEITINAGVQISNNGFLFAGFGLNAIPIHWNINHIESNEYVSDMEHWRFRSYFIGLTVFQFPVSFEYQLPLSTKNKLLIEGGISFNFNTNTSYRYTTIINVDDYDVFQFELNDYKGTGFFPSGIFKIGYLRSISNRSAVSVSTRLNLSGFPLGTGGYSFHGFSSPYKGNVKQYANSISLDIAYKFTANKK